MVIILLSHEDPSAFQLLAMILRASSLKVIQDEKKKQRSKILQLFPLTTIPQRHNNITTTGYDQIAKGKANRLFYENQQCKSSK